MLGLIEYMNNFFENFKKQSNLFLNDNPLYLKNIFPTPEKYLSWHDVEQCLNYPELFDFEVIDPHTNSKIEIPSYRKTWVWSKLVQDKSFIFDKINNGFGLVILNYGSYNDITNQLLKYFEQEFYVNAAIHVYCNIKENGSFFIHEDYPSNFIIQVEGTTPWKVYNNRLSNLYPTGIMNNFIKEKDLSVALDVVLEPGDVLYIPSRMYHYAKPCNKRLSMSIPCWNKYKTDPEHFSIDRERYKLNYE